MPPNAESASASRARDVGVGGDRAGRHAARVGVLDHRRGRLVELEDDAGGGVEVEQVGERQLLALKDGRRAPRPCGRRRRRTTPPAGAGSRRSAGRAASRAVDHQAGRRQPGGAAAGRLAVVASRVAERRGDGRCRRRPVCAKARRARSKRNAGAGPSGGRAPPAPPRSRRVDTTTRTSRKFLAAARTRLGPPMSICSIRSSNGVAGSAAARANGYRLTTTTSMSADAVRRRRRPGRPARARRARMPPWICGCSVLTRPSIISGKPVTSRHAGDRQAGRRPGRVAVPPVDTSSKPRAASPRAKSTRPVLSETLSSARAHALRSPQQSRWANQKRNCASPDEKLADAS